MLSRLKGAWRWFAGTTAIAVVLPGLALASDVTGVASSMFGCSFPNWEDGCHSHLIGLLRPAAKLPKSEPLSKDQFVVPLTTGDVHQLYVGSTGSTDLRRLPTLMSRSFSAPSLTKDRRTVVYVDSGGDVRAVAANGTQDRLLTHTPTGCGRIRHVSLNFAKPKYLVVECRQDETKGSLLVMDTHGQIVRTLALGLERVDDPSVSPDGAQVVYWGSPNLSTTKNGGSIYSVPFDGSREPADLTDSRPGTDADPTISPDGRTIAFRRKSESSSYDIWVMNIDGTGQRPLLARSGRDQKPAWSSDGSHLLAVHQPSRKAGRTQQENLVEIEVATGQFRDLPVRSTDMLTAVWWHR